MFHHSIFYQIRGAMKVFANASGADCRSAVGLLSQVKDWNNPYS
jgi:hypothetical protein